MLNKFKTLVSFCSSYCRYIAKFKRIPCLNNPSNINEMIIRNEFFTGTAIRANLSDKYLVRDYVEKKGLGYILVTLYGVYDNASDIDFDILPNSFVIKINNGCNNMIIVKDKTVLNIEETKKELNKALKIRLGLFSGEPHYLEIKPKIIIEELLPIDESVSSSLIDYKFWCFNGKVKGCLACCNRNIKTHKCHFIHYEIPEWKERKDLIHKSFANNSHIEKPSNLDEMIECAEILSQNFSCVRVDLYSIKGKTYFGELTFTSNGGRMRYYTDEALKILGSFWQ